MTIYAGTHKQENLLSSREGRFVTVVRFIRDDIIVEFATAHQASEAERDAFANLACAEIGQKLMRDEREGILITSLMHAPGYMGYVHDHTTR